MDPSLADELGSLATFMERVAETPGVAPAQVIEIAADDPNLELTEQIGAGGRGVVFLARDRKLDRKVALKVHKTSGSDEANEELLNEAKAMAQVAHPNIVTVFDVRSVGGHLVLLMEYVPGPTLREWLEGDSRESGEILAVFRAAGEGLAAAHEVGLVHRDFKPSNVIIGESGRVRVADFGLAISRDIEGSRAGTPAYMAPEQKAGAAIDARADQFAFAVALTEALGDAPVTKQVRAALLRASAESPQERWPTMRSLLTELAPAKSRRGQFTIAAIAAVAIASICGVAMFAIDRMAGSAVAVDCSAIDQQWDEAWNGRVAAAVEDGLVATKRPHAARYAARVSQQLDRHGETWRAARALSCSERQPRRSQCLDRQLAHIEVVGSRLQTADAVTADRALDLIEAALDGGGCEAPETWPKAGVDQDRYLAIARRIDDIGVDRIRGEDGQALEVAARVARVVDGKRMPRLAAELAMHQTLAGGSGEPDRALLTPNERAEVELASPGANATDVRRHVDALQRADAPSRIREQALTRLAEKVGAVEKSELLTRALELRRSELGEDNPILYPLLSQLTGALIAAGRNTVARSLLADALELVERFDLGKAALIESLERLARIQADTRHGDAAISDYERLLTLHDETDPKYKEFVFGLGVALVNEGELERAFVVCSDAVRRFEEAGVRTADLAAAHYCIGRSVVKRGDEAVAHKHFVAAVDIAEETNSDFETFLNYNFGVVNTLIGLGKPREAVAVFAKLLPEATARQRTQMRNALRRNLISERLWPDELKATDSR